MKTAEHDAHHDVAVEPFTLSLDHELLRTTTHASTANHGDHEQQEILPAEHLVGERQVEGALLEDQREDGEEGRQDGEQEHVARKAFAVEHQDERTGDERGPGIGLQHDECHGVRMIDGADDAGAEVHQGLEAAEVARQCECGGELGELGGLDAEAADREPGLCAIHLLAEEQHQCHQGRITTP
jgi:hypothetical protein